MSALPTTENWFSVWLDRYSGDPVLFVREMWGVEPDDWQAVIMREVASGRRKLAVRSGHGVGKSTVAAWLMIWFLLTRYPSKTVVTAPTGPQLWDALFAEVKGWVGELPEQVRLLLEVKAESIELVSSPDKAFISARTSRAEQPQALAGIHSEHVMLIADEASDVPAQVFEAAGGSMSGHNAVMILLGNPIRSSGYFYDCFFRLAHEWFTLRVSCADSPRASAAYVQEIAERYGEGSNQYRVRVLGEFPLTDDDTVISWELVEAAMRRHEVMLRDGTETPVNPTATVVWGLDVARFGADSSCLIKRKANMVIEPPRIWRNRDLMSLTGAVMAEYDSSSEKPVEILVDSIGIGAGVSDRLRELKTPARGINVSESPALKSMYRNLRAELWYKAKAWFEQRDCYLPRDERLLGELTTVRYNFTSNGNIFIESKDDMKKRGLHSPDVADAFVLTFAGDAATALYGNAYDPQFGKPLRRGLSIC